MTTYFKATRENGTDFRTGTIQYDTDELVQHPYPDLAASASCYLSVATVPTDCTSFRWPCRLFEVEPVGMVATDGQFPNKRRVTALKRVRELPAHEAFGPQGEHLVRLLAAIRGMSAEQIDAARDAARDAAWVAARDAAWVAAWDAAWDAARDVARDAARDAALALLVRDIIPRAHYEVLTRPLRLAGITVHPDDPELEN